MWKNQTDRKAIIKKLFNNFEILASLEDLGISTDQISAVSSALVQVSENEILTAGISLDSFTSAFDPCLDVLATARAMVYWPKMSEVLNFDWTDFGTNLIRNGRKFSLLSIKYRSFLRKSKFCIFHSLANDGVNCYVIYNQANGKNSSTDQILGIKI